MPLRSSMSRAAVAGWEAGITNSVVLKDAILAFGARALDFPCPPAILACVQSSTAPKQASSADALARDLGLVMKHLLSSTSRDFFAELERLDLSITQLKMIGVLTEAGEPASIKAVSDSIGLSVAAVSRGIEDLVQRELVTRAEDPRDRRSKLVRVTARGRRTLEQLYALRLAALRGFVEQLDAGERETLSHGLRPILALLDR